MKQITLSGVIGWDVTAQDLRDGLKEANGAPVEIVISSPGGFVFAGLEMFNLVRNYPGETTARLSGYAMSIASYIPLAADRIVAEDNAIYMIHNVSGGIFGDHNQILNYGASVKGMSRLTAKAYAKRTGKPLEEIEAMMDRETYFYGSDMVDHGFVDELLVTNDDKDPETARAMAAMAFGECANRMASDLSAVKQDLAACANLLAMTATSAPEHKEKKTMKLDDLKMQHPDLCQALIEEGKQMAAADQTSAIETARKEGAAAELARIKGIEEQCSIPGHEQLVASLKYDGTTTAEQAALQILGAEKQLRSGALTAMQNEANPVVPNAAASATGDSEQAAPLPADAPVAERAKAEWDGNPALKKEFTSESAYVAFRKNEEAGLARILKK